MINVSVQIEVLTLGDGENHTDSWLYNNPNGVPPSQQVIHNGNNGGLTVTVPAQAKGVCIVWPTTNVTRAIKGLPGDTGDLLGTSPNFLAIFFPSPGAVTSFVCSALATETWTFIWL